MDDEAPAEEPRMIRDHSRAFRGMMASLPLAIIVWLLVGGIGYLFWKAMTDG